MKKQFLLPILAVIFAVSSAFASNIYTIEYYAPSDTECNGQQLDEPQCTPGIDEPCLDPVSGQQFNYKDTSDPVPTCKELRYDVNGKK